MIKNSKVLLSHGQVEIRKKALDILRHALAAVDPQQATHRHVSLNGDTLRVGTQTFDLQAYKNIYAIGAGKATYLQAVALEEITRGKTDRWIHRGQGWPRRAP